MDNIIRQDIINHAGQLMDQGYHCSEAVLLSVGGCLLGDEKAKAALPFASPFAGGVGGTRAELCGALTGGLMVIGGMCGRKHLPTPDDDCQALAARYREAFQNEFGWLGCCELKEHWVGKEGQESCRELVKRAAEILIDVTEGVS